MQRIPLLYLFYRQGNWYRERIGALPQIKQQRAQCSSIDSQLRTTLLRFVVLGPGLCKALIYFATWIPTSFHQAEGTCSFLFAFCITPAHCYVPIKTCPPGRSNSFLLQWLIIAHSFSTTCRTSSSPCGFWIPQGYPAPSSQMPVV